MSLGKNVCTNLPTTLHFEIQCSLYHTFAPWLWFICQSQHQYLMTSILSHFSASQTISKTVESRMSISSAPFSFKMSVVIFVVFVTWWRHSMDVGPFIFSASHLFGPKTVFQLSKKSIIFSVWGAPEQNCEEFKKLCPWVRNCSCSNPNILWLMTTWEVRCCTSLVGYW